MQSVEAPIQPLFSKSAKDRFYPFTAAMSSTPLKEVLFAMEVATLSGGGQVRPGVQFSADGLSWDAPAVFNAEDGTAWATTAGWKRRTTWDTLPGSATLRLYCRFGVVVEAGTLANVGMRLQFREVPSRTITGGPGDSRSRG